MELINIAILYHVLKVNKWSTDVQFKNALILPYELPTI